MARVRYPKEILDTLITRAKDVSPDECRGVMSGVRTRRGIEVVALHEFESISRDPSRKCNGVDSKSDNRGLLLKASQQTKLMELLEAAGTPMVCIYKSNHGVGNESFDEDDWMALGEGGPRHPEVEYLVLSLKDQELDAARAFSWNGKSFVGRDVRLEGN